MSIEDGGVVGACIGLSCRLKERHPREMAVINHEAVQPGTTARALQLDLDSLQAVAVAIALGIDPNSGEWKRALEVMTREGLLMRSNEPSG